MLKNDHYRHYKGNAYEFLGIAMPIQSLFFFGKQGFLEKNLSVHAFTARYHENTVDLEAFVDANNVLYIDAKLPHVIYKSDAGITWAREVDDFFSSVSTDTNGSRPRFERLPEDNQ